MLTDSSGHLKWGKPKQVRIAETHRQQPSFLQSTLAITDETPTPVNATVIQKTQYTELSEGLPPIEPVANSRPLQPAQLQRQHTVKATPLHVARDVFPLKPTVAFQDTQEDANDIFDDVLDQLVPGSDDSDVAEDGLPDLKDDGALPDLQDDSPAGTDEFPFDLEEDMRDELLSSGESDDDLLFDDATQDDLEFDLPGEEDVSDELPDAEPAPSETLIEEFPQGLEPTPTVEAESQPRIDPQPTVPTVPVVPEPEPGDLPSILVEPEPTPAAPPKMSPSETLSDTPPLDGNEYAASPEFYNGRDCLTEMSGLKEAWEELRRRPIRQISLDITPQIEPNESKQEEADARRENMAMAPARKWRDRRGAIVATGKLADFRNGQVFVLEADGSEQKLSWYELSNDDLCFVTAWWELPCEFNPHSGEYRVRDWTRMTFTWKASALCHKPLYFEEVQLERYGHSAGPVKQAALSGAHFFGNIFFLPYHIGLNPINECQYALGYYRPGSCAPWMLPAIPLSARGARWQVGALVAGLTLLP